MTTPDDNTAASNKQILANRKNAKLGGVKTIKGKENSRLNALKHGILSNMINKNEKDQFLDIYKNLCEDYKPLKNIEYLLIERASYQLLKLKRLTEAETDYISYCLEPDVLDAFCLQTLGEKNPKIRPEQMEQIGKIYQRYETAIENRLYKALKELREMKKNAALL